MDQLAAAFFAGAFLFNAIPHLVRGICGKRHMTPFNVSSGPATNVVWAWINLAAGGVIWKSFVHGTPTLSIWVAMGIGGFITSLGLAIFWTNPKARLPWHKG
ncbi:MAG: hypothetical protein RDU20_13995 [Desulfomonilaceae bacterium]|nr:hypothetical protein [Desulfomonilaceae bacterium]